MLRSASYEDMVDVLCTVLRRTARRANVPMRKLHDSLLAHFGAIVALGDQARINARRTAIEMLHVREGWTLSSERILDEARSTGTIVREVAASGIEGVAARNADLIASMGLYEPALPGIVSAMAATSVSPGMLRTSPQLGTYNLQVIRGVNRDTAANTLLGIVHNPP